MLMVVVAGLLILALLSAGAKPPAATAATAHSAKASPPAAAARDAPRPKRCPRHFPDCGVGPATEATALAMLATSVSPLDSVYLYAEAGDGWQRGRVYDVFEDHLEPRRLNNGLAATIDHLWQIPAAGRKWTSVELTVADGHFRIAFEYDEPPPPAKQSVTRRADAKARAKYPDLPIWRAGKAPRQAPAEEQALDELPKT
ncbi:MAG: hypothetical protein INF91_10170 [Alphaproteobacteria bacterium]|nr:hypothetical protein [Alphaproteobacteria bacterium]